MSHTLLADDRFSMLLMSCSASLVMVLVDMDEVYIFVSLMGASMCRTASTKETRGCTSGANAEVTELPLEGRVRIMARC